MVKTKKARISLFVVGGILTVGMVGVPLVQADRFDEAMNALKAQNNATQSSINDLATQANDFQAVINQLSAQISGVQEAINANQARQAQLEQQIAANKAKIEKNKQILGDDLKKGYVEGQISTVEMLATSNDLSDYVDKQEYRSTVQSKMQQLITETQALQAQLEKQNAEVQGLIRDQQAQRAELASNKARQAELLAYNQSQQNAFSQQIKTNNAEINKLRSQQAAENARLFAGSRGVVQGGTCGGNYPNKWCNAPMDSMVDNWGMYNRECVSYTAWKVYESGRYMPYWGGKGNAKQWDDNARAAGIPVDTSPRAGDVAIKNSGEYGHAMYVESVNDDGTINISQYNASWDGRYSTASRVSTAGLVFIHF